MWGQGTETGRASAGVIPLNVSMRSQTSSQSHGGGAVKGSKQRKAKQDLSIIKHHLRI